MTLTEALSKVMDEFKDCGIESPDLDARILLAHVLKIDKHRLIIDGDKNLSPGKTKKYYALAGRRLKNEPVAYITGKKEFYSLDFLVTKDVLIPRPETEQIVELAISIAGENDTVLDVGTGSGAIAIALKKNRPDLNVFACDISAGSLKIAKKNAHIIIGDNSILFSRSDLFSAYKDNKFDLIVSNPPYLNAAEKISFQKELLYEPASALFAAGCGTDIIKKLLLESPDYLKSNGALILEFGAGQESFLQNIAEKYYSVKIYKDFANLPRIALLQKL
jgi:release factor glutamine methyltransferase